MTSVFIKHPYFKQFKGGFNMADIMDRRDMPKDAWKLLMRALRSTVVEDKPLEVQPPSHGADVSLKEWLDHVMGKAEHDR